VLGASRRAGPVRGPAGGVWPPETAEGGEVALGIAKDVRLGAVFVKRLSGYEPPTGCPGAVGRVRARLL
jgi:hypothetical protein